MEHHKEILSFECNVTGIRFYSGRRKLHSLAKINLVRDKNNDKDTNAVSVFIGEEQLGFIERNVARHLAVLMDTYPRRESGREQSTSFIYPPQHTHTQLNIMQTNR